MIHRRRTPCRGLALLAAGLTATLANAACPPIESDGSAIRKGGLTLAWHPLLTGEKAPKAGRIPMAKHFALEVQLCDKDAVSDGQLQKADATMPAHRHGMNYRPAIKPLGAGRFRVEGMMFHMAGQWELAFEVKAGGETLRLTQEVQAD
jgi:hypothetical protein